jgi:hypothetical protein
MRSGLVASPGLVRLAIRAMRYRSSLASRFVFVAMTATSCHSSNVLRHDQTPKEWSCSKSFFDDHVCDCGCSAADTDCPKEGTCTSPSCHGAKASACVRCHDATGFFSSCAAQAPSGWLCPTERFGDGNCDCGCGIDDVDCPEKGACSEPGCTDETKACAACHDARGELSACPNTVPEGWLCRPEAFNDGTCDCGCGAADGDCVAGCVAPNCNGAAARTCGRCHDARGELFNCRLDAPDGWTCSPRLFGDGKCDCGCSVADADCRGAGCTASGCTDDLAHCELCHDAKGAFNCGHSSAPETWLCDRLLWENGECDCGCGVADIDCVAGGCAAPGCGEPADCKQCHDAKLKPYDCAAPPPAGWLCLPHLYGICECDCGCGVACPNPCSGPICTEPGCEASGCARCFDGRNWFNCGHLPPSEWSCDPKRFADQDHICDCGCGAPDPDCSDAGCAAPGCEAPACERCVGDDGEPRDCVPSAWSCAPQLYFTSNRCICGCGIINRGCYRGDVCTTPGCKPSAESDCTDCFDAEGQPFFCNGAPSSWLCDPAFYGDGPCGCGCGASDPDCAPGTGCAEPGCAEQGCDACYRTTNTIAGRKAMASFDCSEPPPASWPCDVVPLVGDESGYSTYGDRYCDCGCGVPDPDCNGAGCTTPGCNDAACDACHGTDGDYVKCGEQLPPANWTCSSSQYYADKDSLCICGCGVPSQACAAGRGCGERGCHGPAAVGCDWCTDAAGDYFHCGQPPPPAEWRCDAEDYFNGTCDCGCGTLDLDCVRGCTEPGPCPDEDCDYCHDSAGNFFPCERG